MFVQQLPPESTITTTQIKELSNSFDNINTYSQLSDIPTSDLVIDRLFFTKDNNTYYRYDTDSKTLVKIIDNNYFTNQESNVASIGALTSTLATKTQEDNTNFESINSELQLHTAQISGNTTNINNLQTEVMNNQISVNETTNNIQNSILSMANYNKQNYVFTVEAGNNITVSVDTDSDGNKRVTINATKSTSDVTKSYVDTQDSALQTQITNNNTFLTQYNGLNGVRRRAPFRIILGDNSILNCPGIWGSTWTSIGNRVTFDAIARIYFPNYSSNTTIMNNAVCVQLPFKMSRGYNDSTSLQDATNIFSAGVSLNARGNVFPIWGGIWNNYVINFGFISNYNQDGKINLLNGSGYTLAGDGNFVLGRDISGRTMQIAFNVTYLADWPLVAN